MRATGAIAAVCITACLWACSAGPGPGAGPSPGRETTPAEPAASAGLATPAEPAASAELATPAEPAAPAELATPAEPAASAEPAAPTLLTGAPCPPAEPHAHCVLLTLRPGAGARAAAFIERAARDGIEVHREGSLLATYLTDAEITRHFGGRVVHQRVAASASNTGAASACSARVEDVKIPAQYARDLASITIGHQICE